MWDTKYRPIRFADVLGQEGTVQVLKSRLKAGTALDMSYIFSGGFGQGKTTLARILGRGLLCEDLREDGEPCNECDNCRAILRDSSMAFVELDAASRAKIDDIRKIVEDLSFAVPGAPKRIYLFDEAHRMSRDSQDVLLKPLEARRLVGIFCTTEPSKIRGTIRSRCEEYPIRKISREDLLKRAQQILQREGVTYEDDAIRTIIDYSGGHVRDVLNRLEMVAQLGTVSLEAVREYLHLSLVTVYYEILLSLGDPSKSVPLVEDACDRAGPESVSAGLAEAAMTSFRLSNGIHTEFIYVDRELAQRVGEMYGSKVIDLSRYFLRSRRPSKISLMCDVLQCASGVPSVTDHAPSTAPPVQVQAPSGGSPVNTPQEPVQAPSEPSSEKAAPHTPPDTHKPSKPPVAYSEGQKGNLGSGDPAALTDDDLRVIPKERPRGADSQERKRRKLLQNQGKKEVTQLTSEQWSRNVYLLLDRLGAGSS